MPNVIRKHSFGDITGYEFGRGRIFPPLMTVFAYHIGGLLIDTAQSNLRNEVLQTFSDHPIRAILLTHSHEDHSGNAKAFSAAHNAPVYASAECAEFMRHPAPIHLYQKLVWGEAEPVDIAAVSGEFEIGGIKLEQISTPGHSPDHAVYLNRTRGALFTGDLYLGDRIRYFRSNEDMAGQIQSLRHITQYDFDGVYCAHHPQPIDGKTHLISKLQFLEDFYGSVAREAEKGKGPRAIMKAIGESEMWNIWLFTSGDVGVRHMVLSALRGITRGEPI